MTRGIRTALWVLSSLAVVWTVSALAMAGTMGSMMGGMMGGGGCPMCGMGTGGGLMGPGAAGQPGAAPGGGGASGGMMGGGGMMGRGGMGGGMMGGMLWMMLTMGLTWVVMLGLDAVFVYLVVTALRAGRGGHSRAATAPTGVQ